MYRINRDFLGTDAGYGQLDPSVKAQVEKAIKHLEKDAFPKQYGYKRVGENQHSIRISSGDETVWVIYEAHVFSQSIDLIQIRLEGPLRKAARRLIEMWEFFPKG